MQQQWFDVVYFTSVPEYPEDRMGPMECPVRGVDRDDAERNWRRVFFACFGDTLVPHVESVCSRGELAQECVR